MNLLELFDRTSVINLPERRDRRRQTERELARHFPAATIAARVQFYDAIRPDDGGPIGNRGSYGCFLSVVDILETAAADGLSSVLVMQDDVQFLPAYRRHAAWLVEELAQGDWDLAQLGYIDKHGATQQHLPSAPVLCDFDEQVIGAHCIGFQSRVFEPMLDHLRTVMAGEPGDRVLGPMPVDGAFNTFKWCHPEIRRLLPVPNLVGQRSSRSDIRPKRHDQVGLLRPLLDVGRAAAERLRGFTRR